MSDVFPEQERMIHPLIFRDVVKGTHNNYRWMAGERNIDGIQYDDNGNVVRSNISPIN